MEPAPSPTPGRAAPNETPARAYPSSPPRNPPLLPTPTERLVFAIFPVILVFGALFSTISPQTRASTFDAAAQAHSQDAPPSYFADKRNLFNQLYVKKGWAWTTVAFAALVAGHPAMGAGADAAGRRARAVLRWALVTGWWVLVTQWCFGPPIIDRGFRWTGGKCEAAVVRDGTEGTGPAAGAEDVFAEVFTAVACKGSGGRWHGGHDVSGHVFLLVLASGFLLQELGWVAGRWTGRLREERTVVMNDGSVRGAGVESQATGTAEGTKDSLGLGGKVAAGAVALNIWMLLMTAIYFHTWFEKLTGLIASLLGLYAVYIVPRLVPSVREVVGLPGI
ncbi:related to SCS3 Inositol phospholipid synthesis protein [Cephalotrichum gorgonifer]|uniref:Acyl-coenzyme A diphosphatase SCS3 n=1 Tax=Cephalotrichum gorgonifer TaxID=2041049 RepID=A0AAE8STW3_9PEZI|nr:related to SCS3 Inositol phospholipid synthesis protein [Cephalotrichum gorgonifer]